MTDELSVKEFSAVEAMSKMATKKLKCKVVTDSSSYYYIKDKNLIHHLYNGKEIQVFSDINELQHFLRILMKHISWELATPENCSALKSK